MPESDRGLNMIFCWNGRGLDNIGIAATIAVTAAASCIGPATEVFLLDILKFSDKTLADI
jgi:hypothetical protein